jgi:hypothetical protein
MAINTYERLEQWTALYSVPHPIPNSETGWRRARMCGLTEVRGWNQAKLYDCFHTPWCWQQLIVLLWLFIASMTNSVLEGVCGIVKGLSFFVLQGDLIRSIMNTPQFMYCGLIINACLKLLHV